MPLLSTLKRNRKPKLREPVVKRKVEIEVEVG